MLRFFHSWVAKRKIGHCAMTAKDRCLPGLLGHDLAHG
ncbi:unnamed protein product, partial [marine sediment metagenome]